MSAEETAPDPGELSLRARYGAYEMTAFANNLSLDLSPREMLRPLCLRDARGLNVREYADSIKKFLE